MSDSINEELSKRVTALRLVLIFFVIVRHNTKFVPDEPLYAFWIKELISNGFFYGNVALSFIFSGYFLSVKKHSYTTVLKRKFHSLVIPYIFWMLFYFVIYVIMFYIPRLHNFGQTIYALNSWSDFDWKTFKRMFLGYGYYLNLPAMAGQLWFLRDLIILSLAYPLFQFFLDFNKKYCIAFTLCCVFIIGFLFQKSILYCFSFYPILFFAIGIICGMYKVNFFEVADKLRYLDLIVGIVILVILNKYKPNFISCYVPLIRVFSSLLWLKFSKILINHEKVFGLLKKFSAYSFFIYAIHFRILVMVIQKLGSKIPSNIFSSGIFSIFWYIFAPLLTLTISVLLGMGVKKVSPKFFSVITGGR